MEEVTEPQTVAPEQKAEEPPTPIPVEPTEPTPTGKPPERGPDVQVVFVTALGFGIRTTLAEFRKAHRGTKGTRAMGITDKNGALVDAKLVEEDDIICIVTKQGQTGIFPVSEIRFGHRGPVGTKLVSLSEGDEVVALL